MTERTCKTCGRSLPLTCAFFHRSAQEVGGFVYRCKDCSKKRRDVIRDKASGERWYQENKEHKKILAKNWRSNLRLEVLRHYAYGIPRCACCGEDHLEFLAIDHINGGGNQDRKVNGSGTAFYLRLRKHGYPEGFQVLCHNCNFAKSAYNRCPHEDD